MTPCTATNASTSTATSFDDLAKIVREIKEKYPENEWDRVLRMNRPLLVYGPGVRPDKIGEIRDGYHRATGGVLAARQDQFLPAGAMAFVETAQEFSFPEPSLASLAEEIFGRHRMATSLLYLPAVALVPKSSPRRYRWKVRRDGFKHRQRLLR